MFVHKCSHLVTVITIGSFIYHYGNYFHRIIIIIIQVTSQKTVRCKYINFQRNEDTNIITYKTYMYNI